MGVQSYSAKTYLGDSLTIIINFFGYCANATEKQEHFDLTGASEIIYQTTGKLKYSSQSLSTRFWHFICTIRIIHGNWQSRRSHQNKVINV